ncbi:unnamed protein product [Parnassius mnemosyne]|uniref:Uncharacterized protein n=2 Tax=Parnassius mnemosyne TaxID=213953 RepID=A0AAV1KDN0_9NEOP
MIFSRIYSFIAGNTELSVARKMVDRKQASTHKPISQQKLQQQLNRARRILALVPKSGARSDVGSRDDSADELYKYIPPTLSDSSSPPPSLSSSLLDLNLLSDSNKEIDEITHNSPALQLYSSPASDTCASPSIWSPRQSSSILLLQAAEISSPKPGCFGHCI